MATPTRSEAEIATVGAAMPKDIDGAEMMTKVNSRAIIGRFSAPDVAGYIVAKGLIHSTMNDEMLEILRDRMKDQKVVAAPQMLVNLAKAAKDLMKVSIERDESMLKSVEILAVGSKKQNTQANAPQAVITGKNANVTFQTANVVPKSPES